MRARGLKPPISAASTRQLRSRPVRARGLKHRIMLSTQLAGYVAPRAGAWLETVCAVTQRGLIAGSRPVRARGLKLLAPEVVCVNAHVAPRAGAWLETPLVNT